VSPRDADKFSRLKRARIEAGCATAIEAARRFGWNPNTYKSNENGNATFGYEAARAYAAAFGVTAAWLMSGEDSSTPGEGMGSVVSTPSGRVSLNIKADVSPSVAAQILALIGGDKT
jgi:transcriptional regulator with XRE-family HTH domain